MKETCQDLEEILNVPGPEDPDFYGDWIESIVVSGPDTEPLNLNYFSPYNKAFGFKFAVDGFHMAPNSLPYGAIFSLAPPAAHYTEQKDDGVNISCTLDWNSPMKTPLLMDGFFHYKDIAGQANMSIIVDVRACEF